MQRHISIPSHLLNKFKWNTLSFPGEKNSLLGVLKLNETRVIDIFPQKTSSYVMKKTFDSKGSNEFHPIPSAHQLHSKNLSPDQERDFFILI